MSDPLALVPFAAAARGGAIDSSDARQLVAAGITMLQRCAPLVRALARGRGAVLLPDSAAYLVALAACEGRGTVLLDHHASPAEAARTMAATNARVVFTTEQLGTGIDDSVPRVYLDAAPWHATFLHETEHRVVDLGSHFGIDVEGEGDVAGHDEDAVIARDPTSGDMVAITHRAILSAARTIAADASVTGEDRILAAAAFSDAAGITAALIAPLLAGARLTTMLELTGHDLVEHVRRSDATVLVGAPELFAALTGALRAGSSRLDAHGLRLALVTRGETQPGLHAEWGRVAGVELRDVGATPKSFGAEPA